MAIYKTEYSPNYTVVGSPTITDDFVVSNFSTSNYLTSEGKSVLTVADVTSFEIVIDITTGSSFAGASGRILQPLSALNSNSDAANSPFICIENRTIKFVFYNGSSYYSCVTGLNTLAINTRYLFKWTYFNNRGVEGYYSIDGGNTWEGNKLLNWRQIQWAEKEFVLGTRGSGHDTTFRGSIHLKNCYIKVNDEMWWQPLKEEHVDVSGSVEISKGYFSDGSNEINMPASTYNIDALTANQTLGGKNKLFAYTNSTDSVGALITSTTPTGSFKITKDLEHPVYLDPTKNYIAGGELIEPALSFIGTDVSSTKALQYSGDQDKTYWMPSETTVSLASVKAAQSVGPVNDLYLTTTAGTPTASLSFSDNGAIGGVATKFHLKQKVYLNNETDKILGVQERPDEISISGSDNGITVSGWSALYSDVTGYTGNTALDYTTPTESASSSLEIPSGAETAYLWYVNGDIKCKLSTDPVLNKAVFTGYALTLNNGTISGVVKRGELCAAFVQRGSERSSRRYLFIPAANLKDGSFTTRAGQGFYDMSVNGTLPPSEVGASMGNVEYDSTNKTAIFEGATFDYIGNMMCKLG